MRLCDRKRRRREGEEGAGASWKVGKSSTYPGRAGDSDAAAATADASRAPSAHGHAQTFWGWGGGKRGSGHRLWVIGEGGGEIRIAPASSSSSNQALVFLAPFSTVLGSGGKCGGGSSEAFDRREGEGKWAGGEEGMSSPDFAALDLSRSPRS